MTVSHQLERYRSLVPGISTRHSQTWVHWDGDCQMGNAVNKKKASDMIPKGMTQNIFQTR
ncbi:hypothetical protein PSENEW3_00003403 [Picochlorum sp. SENEW3]|nr:hypothetical protein PSENEW3_00003403 [Picochlorum sp. SENEW3]